METVESIETSNVAVSSSMHTGRVKWFNNKAGYGFITVTDGLYGVGKDVFVHHTNIVVSNEQYTYLIQGEYVNFKVEKTTDDSTHESHAVQVQGISGGKLMCETRFEFRRDRSLFESQKRDSRTDDDEYDVDYVRQPQKRQRPSVRQQQQQSSVPRQFQSQRKSSSSKVYIEPQDSTTSQRPSLQRTNTLASTPAKSRGSGPRDDGEWKFVSKKPVAEKII
jgi:cold shock CspA family protein